MKKIYLKIIYISALIIGYSVFFTGCGDQALFDELATDRIKVYIKGTYESNNPRPWDDLSTIPIPAYDDSYNDVVADVIPTRFMIDIAGLRIYSGDSEQDFANYRRTCSANLTDSIPFFNGEGILYENDDVRPDFYCDRIGMFIRKMLFDGAVDFPATDVLDWGSVQDVNAIFQEETVEGYNFNLAQVLSYYDYLKNNYDEVNRIFPFIIPFEDGFVFDYDEEEVVMEIRLVVKNFVKKYEYEYDDGDGVRWLRHFYGLSDWLSDVKRSEAAPTSDTMGILGGNVLGVARYYVPGKTATITGNASSSNRYVVAVRTKYDISNFMRSATERTRPNNSGTSTICDAPKTPRVPINPNSVYSDTYMKELLDYYLKYELYKENYDAFVDCTNDEESTGYESLWDTYYALQSTYRIPPLATYVSSGTAFSLTTVPKGEYNIYESEASITAGNLPETFTLIGTVSITEANFNGYVSVP